MCAAWLSHSTFQVDCGISCNCADHLSPITVDPAGLSAAAGTPLLLQLHLAAPAAACASGQQRRQRCRERAALLSL
jgi:hypothetical protein